MGELRWTKPKLFFVGSSRHGSVMSGCSSRRCQRGRRCWIRVNLWAGFCVGRVFTFSNDEKKRLPRYIGRLSERRGDTERTSIASSGTATCKPSCPGMRGNGTHERFANSRIIQVVTYTWPIWSPHSVIVTLRTSCFNTLRSARMVALRRPGLTSAFPMQRGENSNLLQWRCNEL